MKMLLAALKRIRDNGPIEKDKGICGNVRLLVPRKQRVEIQEKSTALSSVGLSTKDTLWCTQLRTRDGCTERVRNSAFCGRTRAAFTCSTT